MRKLSGHRAQRVQDLLGRYIDQAAVKEILDVEIPEILDGYDLLQTSAGQLSLAESRRRLKLCGSAARRLLATLQNFNGGATLMFEFVEHLTVDAAKVSVRRILESVEKAEFEYSFHRPGREIDGARFHVAEMVSMLVYHNLGRRPTTSADGICSELLALILEEATGKEVREVRELARRGVAQFKLIVDSPSS